MAKDVEKHLIKKIRAINYYYIGINNLRIIFSKKILNIILIGKNVIFLSTVTRESQIKNSFDLIIFCSSHFFRMAWIIYLILVYFATNYYHIFIII